MVVKNKKGKAFQKERASIETEPQSGKFTLKLDT